MKTLTELLEEIFQKACLKAFPEAKEHLVPEITPSTQEKFGHYQMNSAMRWSKILGQNPRNIAEKIVEKTENPSLFEKIEIAGPGFINCTLSSSFLETVLLKMIEDQKTLAVPLPKKEQKVIIDFSSPNTAKEMHVGHLRSTIIGDCLARIFVFFQDEVHRINHVGDWGTAFGMLIAYLKENQPQVLSGEEKTDLSHLVNWYKQAKKIFDEDESFKKRSQKEVVFLQSGEKASKKAWEIICDISRKAYQEIYDLLDIHLIERGESFYNPYLKEIIEDLTKKGLIEISDGAKCMFLEGFTNREGDPLPLILQKSDGGFNYATTDMATLRYRVQVEKGDHLIYVTDTGQQTHFAMIFAAGEKAGYVNPKKVKLDHVPFGLVLGPDGKKFRTRSGDTEPLVNLLYTAIDKSADLLREKNPDMSEEEIKNLSKVIGLSSVKYADLSCHRTSDYQFSYERMLKFEGNTASFLLYAYVRIQGIKRKSPIKVTDIQPKKIVLKHPSEIALGLHLGQFSEALLTTKRELLPNRLTDYLYHLAEKFHAFFRDCQVIGDENQESRLLLSDLTGNVLKKGLELLGLKTVEKM